MKEIPSTQDLVKPELPGGFKDYGPSQVLARQHMLRAIESVLRRFGFVPLQTSIGQRRMVLTGGKPTENRLWDMRVSTSRITSDPEQIVTARFDLTVPLARYVAEHMGTLTFPFRRYEFGDVFRGESPQAGRFCEFMQYDADIVGAQTGPADAEIILCMAAVMHELGITAFQIKVNNRKVLNGFAERVGLTARSRQAAALLRVMDKADKIGLSGVLAELSGKTILLDEEEAFALGEKELAAVTHFMQLTDGLSTNSERLAVLHQYFNGCGIGAEGVDELELIASLLSAGGMPEDKWVIDCAVARGLGYYTGPVFETILTDIPTFGSVYSGGRFDDLVARFTGESLPAVGASVGVDRLFAALEKLGVLEATEPDVDVFVITMDPRFMPEYFRMASELRQAGLRVEINMSRQDSSMRAQMAFGLTRRAPILIFFGTNDAEQGTVGVRNTKTRKQISVPRHELVQNVLTTLGRPS